MVQAIVFDMGNVLLEWNVDKILAYFEEEFDRRAYLHQAIFESGLWEKQDTGEMSQNQVYQLLLEELDSSYYSSLKSIIFDWYQVVDVYYDMQAYGQTLKAQGYQVYVLSNTSAVYADLRRAGYLPLNDHLDGCLLSYQEGVIKPDPAIFRIFLDRYQVQAEDCVFLDDMAANVQAAKDLGFAGIQVRSEGQAIQDLRNFLEDEPAGN